MVSDFLLGILLSIFFTNIVICSKNFLNEVFYNEGFYHQIILLNWNYMCLYHAEFYPYQISFIPNVSSLDGHPSWITAWVWAVDGQNHDLVDGNFVVADLNFLVSALQRLRKLVKIVVKLISYNPEIWNSDSKCILNWKH